MNLPLQRPPQFIIDIRGTIPEPFAVIMQGAPIIFLVFIGLIIVLIIVAGVYSVIAAGKRREELAKLAGRLGLSFDVSNDAALADRFEFLNKLAQGLNRYAFNVLRGDYQGDEVLAFDYHYETHTRSKGRRQTHHHYFSFFILLLPLPFPELRITKEGVFSKIGQFLGYDDIDFESAEFSRSFCVRSKDKRFAYDVCHARMIEYLLANRDLNIEIERNALALAFAGQLSAEDVESNLQRLIEIRSLLPEYLVSKVT